MQAATSSPPVPLSLESAATGSRGSMTPIAPGPTQIESCPIDPGVGGPQSERAQAAHRPDHL